MRVLLQLVFGLPAGWRRHGPAARRRRGRRRISTAGAVCPPADSTAGAVSAAAVLAVRGGFGGERRLSRRIRRWSRRLSRRIRRVRRLPGRVRRVRLWRLLRRLLALLGWLRSWLRLLAGLLRLPHYGYYPYDYSYPYDYGYGYGSSYPASYNTSPNVTVVYPQQGQAPVYTPPPSSVTRRYDEYGQEVGQASGGGSPIYLIAFQDHAIRAAASYWVEGKTLHYVTLEHEERQAPLDTVDRDLTVRLNRERRVQIQLPQ